jgi:transposase InsO family protein
MIEGWKATELQEYCAEKGVDWKFITPAAPHHNGCAESLVKSCKLALKKSIGEQILMPFELYTVLQEGHLMIRTTGPICVRMTCY